MLSGSTGSIRATLFDENPGVAMTGVHNGTFLGNSLLPTAGALDFSADADEMDFASNVPFRISNSLVQGNSSLVAAHDDVS